MKLKAKTVVVLIAHLDVVGTPVDGGDMSIRIDIAGGKFSSVGSTSAVDEAGKFGAVGDILSRMCTTALLKFACEQAEKRLESEVDNVTFETLPDKEGGLLS